LTKVAFGPQSPASGFQACFPPGRAGHFGHRLLGGNDRGPLPVIDHPETGDGGTELQMSGRKFPAWTFTILLLRETMQGSVRGLCTHGKRVQLQEGPVSVIPELADKDKVNSGLAGFSPPPACWEGIVQGGGGRGFGSHSRRSGDSHSPAVSSFLLPPSPTLGLGQSWGQDSSSHNWTFPLLSST
jgi:hypothetical protein